MFGTSTFSQNPFATADISEGPPPNIIVVSFTGAGAQAYTTALTFGIPMYLSGVLAQAEKAGFTTTRNVALLMASGAARVGRLVASGWFDVKSSQANSWSPLETSTQNTWSPVETQQTVVWEDIEG